MDVLLDFSSLNLDQVYLVGNNAKFLALGFGHFLDLFLLILVKGKFEDCSCIQEAIDIFQHVLKFDLIICK